MMSQLDKEQEIDRIFEILAGEVNDSWFVAQRALVDIGEPVIGRLIKVLAGEVNNAWVAAYRALIETGEPAIEPLIKALEENDTDLRCRIAGILSSFEDKRAIEALIGLLKDENADVRFCAVSALGRIGNVAALPALEWIKENDTAEYGWGWDEDKMNKAAAKAIEQIKQKQDSNKAKGIITSS